MDRSANSSPRPARDPLPFALAGVAVAGVCLVPAAASGPPYLSLSELNPWLVGFALGLFGALFATPFVIHHRIGGLLEADARWERALLLWGAVTIGALTVGILCGVAGDFSSDSLAGSVGLVVIVEAALVLATLFVWLISG